jgi:hypothetical protein
LRGVSKDGREHRRLRPSFEARREERRAPQDDGGECDASDAIFRKHSRHRQSPPSTGIGSRTVSSAHQQGPDRLQVNSVPQPAQARRREAGVSNRFVMNRTPF